MLGVAISAALIVGVIVLTASYGYEAQRIISSAFNPRTIVLFPRGMLFTDVDVVKLARLEGVTAVVPSFSMSCRITGMGAPRDVTVIATRIPLLKMLAPSLRVAEGIETDQPGTLMAGWYVAHPPEQTTPFLSPGTVVYLDCMGVKRRYIVAGVYAPYGAAPFINIDSSVFIPIADLASIVGFKGYTVLYILVANVKLVDRVAKAIQDMYGRSVQVMTFKALVESITQFSTLLTMFFISLAAMSTVVAGLGISSTMMMSVQQRSREIGVLKAIGYTDRQVLTLFLSEAAMIGILGGVVGCLAGLVVGYILTRSVIGILTFRIDPVGIALTLLYSLGVAVLAGLYPAWRASKLDPAIVLRYE
ncbi:MAG: ABC transporter permease [Crenarchaeota archaeon]|nr:ABC transporter permease [Thermoproteota archaeon]